MSNHFKNKKQICKDQLAKLRNGCFDIGNIHFMNPILTGDGILLIYFVKKPFALGAALFSKKNPEKLLWRSDIPLWKTKKNVSPLRAVMRDGKLYVYFRCKKGEDIEVCFSEEWISGKPISGSVLEKSPKNPIIKPIPKNRWESKQTFNPAVIYEDGKVHMVYRAIGDSDSSVLGYASTKDGFHIDERLIEPICDLICNPKDTSEHAREKLSAHFSYMSGGGGHGGCEDPRITRIDDNLYMTYTAFDGINPPRVALTSIKLENFLNKRWNWKKPKLISPPGEIHKNWVIFPEKINGKYAILHSICPKILIAYIDSLEGDSIERIDSTYSKSLRKKCWDNWVRGAGPPPIKTKDGWLLLYHAMDDNDPGKYKLGAMLLDLKDPSKILHRSQIPLLEPDQCYENEGFKGGVVYVCGAVIIDDRLFIYYGGADTVICTATANLDEFLECMKHSRPIKMTPSIRRARRIKK